MTPRWLPRSLLAVAACLLTACATVPAGPSTSAMPGTRKGWDQFQADDSMCRGFAANRAGVPGESAAAAGFGSAAVGTILGAAVGGLIGGSDGAAVGAGMGLFTGGVVGAGNAQFAASETQRRYDQVYFQCMYAQGHRVPAPAGFVQAAPRTAVARSGSAPPPDAAVPPPNTPPPDRLPGANNPGTYRLPR